MQWANPRQSSGTASQNRERHKNNIDFNVEADLEGTGAEPSTSAVSPPGQDLSWEASASDRSRREGFERLESDNRYDEHAPGQSSDMRSDRLASWDYYARSRQGNDHRWPARDEDGSKYSSSSDDERAGEDALDLNQPQRPQHNMASWDNSPSFDEADEKMRWGQLVLPFLVVLVILGIAFASLIS
jgi:hypothetical protein